MNDENIEQATKLILESRHGVTISGSHGTGRGLLAGNDFRFQSSAMWRGRVLIVIATWNSTQRDPSTKSLGQDRNTKIC
jgi:hypothetical protein